MELGSEKYTSVQPLYVRETTKSRWKIQTKFKPTSEKNNTEFVCFRKIPIYLQEIWMNLHRSVFEVFAKASEAAQDIHSTNIHNNLEVIAEAINTSQCSFIAFHVSDAQVLLRAKI